MKKIIYPIVSCVMYAWTSKAKIEHIWEQGASQANPDDPRKLMVVLRAKFKEGENDFKGALNHQIAKWKQSFDLVVEEVSSVDRINEVFKRITHVGDKIKPISLLLINGHGNEDGILLNGEDRSLPGSVLMKRDLFDIDWKKNLAEKAKITLLSCSTGSGENSFASFLAVISRKTVIAPEQNVMGLFHMDYEPDLSSVSMIYSGGKEILSETSALSHVFQQVQDRVFTYKDENLCSSPNMSGDTQGFSGGLFKEFIESLGYNTGFLTASEMVNNYILFTMGIGIAGYGIKGINFLAKRVLGNRLKPLTTAADKLGNGMTGFFNFNFGIVANVSSALYHGAEKVCNYFKKPGELQPNPGSKRKKRSSQNFSRKRV